MSSDAQVREACSSADRVSPRTSFNDLSSMSLKSYCKSLLEAGLQFGLVLSTIRETQESSLFKPQLIELIAYLE